MIIFDPPNGGRAALLSRPAPRHQSVRTLTVGLPASLPPCLSASVLAVNTAARRLIDTSCHSRHTVSSCKQMTDAHSNRHNFSPPLSNSSPVAQTLMSALRRSRISQKLRRSRTEMPPCLPASLLLCLLVLCPRTAAHRQLDTSCRLRAPHLAENKRRRHTQLDTTFRRRSPTPHQWRRQSCLRSDDLGYPKSYADLVRNVPPCLLASVPPCLLLRASVAACQSRCDNGANSRPCSHLPRTGGSYGIA